MIFEEQEEQPRDEESTADTEAADKPEETTADNDQNDEAEASEELE